MWSSASYRIQVPTAGGFDAVAALTPYLRDLGVSLLYLSPVSQARRGSDHGYDVVDPGLVDAALGGLEGFERLGGACRATGMALILDIVPNHMAISHENPRWWSVLEQGTASPFAQHFDIDWDEPVPPVRGRVVLPILGRRYHRVLEAGELQVARARSGYLLRYFDHVLPLDVSSDAVLSGGGAEDEAEADRVVASLNRDRPDADARARLDALLSRQPYWLVHWRTAPEEANYRRFFDITHLVALRMEREDVFRDWHATLSALLARFPIGGLRVDHVDGLSDPERYLARLRKLVVDAGAEDVALLVEKILAPGEGLPDVWDVDGTSGYDFLAAVGEVLVGAAGAARVRRRYREFTASRRGFHEAARRNKRKAIQSHFRRDLARLVRLALPLVREDPRGRDLAGSEVEATLLEITIELDVYRTYLTGSVPDARAREPLDRAVDRARRARRDLPAGAFATLRGLLALETRDERTLELTGAWQQLTGAVMAKGVEDTTFYLYNPLVSSNEVGAEPASPAMEVPAFHAILAARTRWPRTLNTTSTHDTKRSEDVRARIQVLSELADEWGLRVGRWHEWNRSCRATVGGRVVPTANEEWLLYQTLIGMWPFDGPQAPDFVDRLVEFVRKAAREGKVYTSWYDPRPAHEEALVEFVRRILAPDREEPFQADFADFQERTAFYGAVNSLSQLLLKIAAPGVPDFFQGSELWHLNLVDPDNRRPVDWAHRKAVLEAMRDRVGEPAAPIDAEYLRDVLETWTDGRIKLLLTWRGLACRRRHAALFGEGDYLPIEAEGPARGHLIAFARRRADEWIVAVAPRLPAGLSAPGSFPLGEDAWGPTSLELPAGAPQEWTDAVTGRSLATAPGTDAPTSTDGLRVADVLSRFPVALLHGRVGRPGGA